MAFCTKCGADIGTDYKFCPKCGAPQKGAGETGKGKPSTKKDKAEKKPAESKAQASLAQPTLNIKDVALEPIKYLQVKETVTFEQAEAMSLTKKTQIFGGIFSRPLPADIFVEDFKKIYEPIYRVTYAYEGDFKIEKKYPISVDSSATAVIINNKEIKLDKQQQPQGATFTPGTLAQVMIDGVERITRKSEKVVYYNSKMQESNMDNYIRGKELVGFNRPASSKDPREVVSSADVSTKDFKNKVTNDLLKRPDIFKECLGESLKISADVIYHPKYRFQCKNNKTGEQKILVFSAVDGNNVPENF